MKSAFLLALGAFALASGCLMGTPAHAGGPSVPRMSFNWDTVYTTSATIVLVPTTSFAELRSVPARYNNGTAAGRYNPNGTWFRPQFYSAFIRRNIHAGAPKTVPGNLAAFVADTSTAYLYVFRPSRAGNPAPVQFGGATGESVFFFGGMYRERWTEFDSLRIDLTVPTGDSIRVSVEGIGFDRW